MRDDFTCFDAGNYMQCTIHRVISIQNANAQTQMRYDLQKYKNGAMQLQTKTVGKAPRESFLQVDLPVHSDPTPNHRKGLHLRAEVDVLLPCYF